MDKVWALKITKLTHMGDGVVEEAFRLYKEKPSIDEVAWVLRKVNPVLIYTNLVHKEQWDNVLKLEEQDYTLVDGYDIAVYTIDLEEDGYVWLE